MGLRAVRASELAALSAWLSPIAVAADAEGFASAASLKSAFQQGDLLLYRDDAGEAFVALTKHAPVRQGTQISFIAVPPTNRRLGIGGRAVLAVERRVAGTRGSIYASVASSTGIALYFWIRLGYRPLTRHAWPDMLPGQSTWMVRDLR